MQTLEDLAKQHDSDKLEHGFAGFYQQQLAAEQDSVRRVMEIGIYRGASLCMWRDFFPAAVVHGVDVELPSMAPDDRVQLHRANQANRQALERVISAAGGSFDLIVDDGGHTMEQQQVSLGFLFPHLRAGGIYVVEDLHTSFMERIEIRDGKQADSFYDTGAAETAWTTHTVIERLARGEALESDFMTAGECRYLETETAEVVVFDRDGDHSHMSALIRKKAKRGIGAQIRGFFRKSEAAAPKVPTEAPAPKPAVESPQQAIDTALALVGDNKLTEAIELLQRATGQWSEEAPLRHVLGSLLGQQGNVPAARRHLERAVEISPEFVGAHTDLGNVHRMGGQLQAAEACYRRALELEPGNASTLGNLAQLQVQRADLAAARETLETLSEIEPDNLEIRVSLANLEAELGQLPQAAEGYRKILAVAPESSDIHSLLGLTLNRMGKLEAAKQAYTEALRLAPDDYRHLNDFSLLLARMGEKDDALLSLRRAIELKPDFAGGHINLANQLRDQRQLQAAVESYQIALELEPGNAGALNNLGNALTDCGRVPEAIASHRQAVEISPEFAEAHSNLLFTLLYDPSVTAAELQREHQIWADHHGREPAQEPAVHVSDISSRPLRIGYVSADFRSHPIGYFIEPILGQHASERFHVTCYADDAHKDEVTERLTALPARWRSLAGLADDAFVDLVRSDEIDILVDLSGHSAGNRLRAFARRCAPVQATWIGYLHSTGLAAMDFLIADEVAIPPGWEERFSESVVRLPNSFLCYGTPADTPEIKPPPLSRGAPPTFGCFSNLAKISSAVVDVWCKLLARHPEAQLYLKNGALADEKVCRRYEQMFAERGIDPTRVGLHGPSSRAEYFDSFSEIDMLLDTFPFSGGTTTCDALWMGVPVVTVPGDTMAGRTSASILSALKLNAYIANDLDDYIERALDGIRNIDELTRLRHDLRDRLTASPLGNAERFTRDLEQAYRGMWEQKVTSG